MTAAAAHAEPIATAVADEPTGEASHVAAGSEWDNAVRQLPSAASLRLIERELAGEAPSDDLLRALASSAWLPQELIEPLALAYPRLQPAQQSKLADALAATATRQAARFLLDQWERVPARSPLHTKLDAALTRLAGIPSPGANPAAWRVAFGDRLQGTDELWNQYVTAERARRLEKLTREGAETVDRLSGTLRQLHLITPQEARWPLVRSMLQDTLTPVVLVGLELTTRELSAGNRPDGATALAVLDLLRSPAPTVRGQSASLVATLGPEGAGPAIARALAAEAKPEVARAMLIAAARFPSPEAEGPILRWLAARDLNDDAPRDAAIDAAWALYRSGYLRREESSSQALRDLRAIPIADLSASGCMLRVELGDRSDRDAIAVLLASSSPAQRLASAEALVTDATYLPRILAAAREEPLLIDVSVRGVLTQDPTVASFIALEEATRRAPEQRRAALVTVASVLDESDVLACAELLRADPVMREAILSVLVSPGRVMTERASPDGLSDLAHAVLSLVEQRVALSRYQDALSALDAIPELASLLNESRVSDLRVACLVAINRLDEARLVSGSPESWLLGLSLAADQPHASRIASLIESTVSAQFTPEQRDRFARLKQQLAAAPGSP